MLYTGFTRAEISTPKPTLKELVKVKVTNWYNLGLQLDIDDDELQAIGCNNPQDQDSCKRGMFRKWLKKSPQASYTQLIRALVDIGDVNEADILCKKHGELDKFAKVVKTPSCCNA